MRSIKKGPEPPLLLQHRKTSGPGKGTFDNLDAVTKSTLREHLVREQGYLCAYCMRRIEPVESTKIEHIEAQSVSRLLGEQQGDPDYARRRGIEHANLLAVCDGGTGQPTESQHCDTRKGDTPITLNPADAARPVEARIRYTPSGRIVANDSTQQPELDDVLGLNLPWLCEARSDAVAAALETLRDRKPTGTWSAERIAQAVVTWERPSARGELRPYLGAVLYELARRRRRAP